MANGNRLYNLYIHIADMVAQLVGAVEGAARDCAPYAL